MHDCISRLRKTAAQAPPPLNARDILGHEFGLHPHGAGLAADAVLGVFLPVVRRNSGEGLGIAIE
jgi:hypothetical protein